MAESSCCFQKWDIKFWHRCLYNDLPWIGVGYYVLIYTHLQRLMKSVGSYGSSWLLFTMNVTVWYFMYNYDCTNSCHVTFQSLDLEFPLQSDSYSTLCGGGNSFWLLSFMMDVMVSTLWVDLLLMYTMLVLVWLELTQLSCKSTTFNCNCEVFSATFYIHLSSLCNHIDTFEFAIQCYTYIWVCSAILWIHFSFLCNHLHLHMHIPWLFGVSFVSSLFTF